jgi:hypothetical protein
VLFAGSYRDVLKNVARQGLCQAMATAPQTDAPCRWDDVDVSGMRVAFVTHSLGSRILFDALNELLGAPKSRERLLPMLNREPSFFMFANQLALLALADRPVLEPPPAPGALPPGNQGLPGFSQALAEARTEDFGIGAPVPVNIVAFSDPNDVLSYRVRTSESYADNSAVRFLNVRISNGVEIPWLIAWPPSAHSGYQVNARVWAVVTSGLPKP